MRRVCGARPPRNLRRFSPRTGTGSLNVGCGAYAPADCLTPAVMNTYQRRRRAMRQQNGGGSAVGLAGCTELAHLVSSNRAEFGLRDALDLALGRLKEPIRRNYAINRWCPLPERHVDRRAIFWLPSSQSAHCTSSTAARSRSCLRSLIESGGWQRSSRRRLPAAPRPQRCRQVQPRSCP